ncbi:MAG: hypothetical protein CMF59_17275 [Leptospiraceae bacterium]|nr:hypothetical protein [Leptospiraceae bacterium]
MIVGMAAMIHCSAIEDLTGTEEAEIEPSVLAAIAVSLIGDGGGGTSTCTTEDNAGTGDSKAQAVALTSGVSATDCTNSATNVYNSYAGPCGTAITSGFDRVYSISVPDGNTLTANISSSNFNPVLIITSDPDIASECKSRTNGNGSGAGESNTYTNSTGGGEVIYVIIDSEGSSGQYTLQLTIS